MFNSNLSSPYIFNLVLIVPPKMLNPSFLPYLTVDHLHPVGFTLEPCYNPGPFIDILN